MTASPTSTLRSAAELRRAFLDYFKQHGHTEVPSSPLVPNDPTLLFTTAGMVQFKPYFTAGDDVPYTRAVSVQKCLRTGDLDNVGITPRHDTFFEMLGNFSFGPRAKGAYFKAEAVAYAWEFVTKVLGLPKERLYVSIFEGEGTLPRDDEAAALWKKMGLSGDHIVALGRADNFWGPAGGAGACGPCSEIYFDLGETRPDYLPDGAFWGETPGDPGDRFMEFWNNVFPQFDAQKDGTLTPLANPGIDTGMGIERLALIMQGKRTIFDTDVFEPMVRTVREMGRGVPEDAKVALRDARIIADHVRALTFAIAEGALPGNEGAGYVLRRLLRRAVTRGRARAGLAIHESFLARGAERAIEIFGGHYRELVERRAQILRVLEQEESNFAETFESGMSRLEKLFEGGAKRVEGAEAFALHDTYGFPIELTEEIAAARGVAVDREGFERAMNEQRDRARASSKYTKGAGGPQLEWEIATQGSDSEFLGYTSLEADNLKLRKSRVSEAARLFEVVLDRTPFYAESGGQVGDRGTLTAGEIEAEVVHVFKEGESIVHRLKISRKDDCRLTFFDAAAAGGVSARVDRLARSSTQRHHTATHLLHAALRDQLGTHVRQAGSLVAPDRLRFDYTHFEPTKHEQLEGIAHMVNQWVLANAEVSTQVLPIAEAKAQGAMALFGEKYGAEVRMVTVPGVDALKIPVSRELCGGTHVQRTGEIGLFRLVSDTAIASGVRRVEALCGLEALKYDNAQIAIVKHVAHALQSNAESAVEQIEKMKAEAASLRKAQSESQRGGLEAEMAKLASEATAGARGRFVVAQIQSDADANAVRDAADRLRGALKTGAAVLAVTAGGKLTFLAAVTDDLVASKALNASDLVKKVAQVTGGSGGGKPHLALAGGKDVAKLDEALAEAKRLLGEALS